MPDTYTVQRSTSIAAPPQAVFSHVADFHRWTAWSPWDDIDPQLQRTYSGADSGTGAKYAWSGNRKAGEGTMEIIEATEGSSVKIALEFLKPFKSSSTTSFELRSDGDSTSVTWTMSGPKTLMTRLMGIFKSMDKMIGPDFEKGLAQLKAAVEQGSA